MGYEELYGKPSVTSNRCMACGCIGRINDVRASLEDIEVIDPRGRRLRCPTVSLCNSCTEDHRLGMLHFRYVERSFSGCDFHTHSTLEIMAATGGHWEFIKAECGYEEAVGMEGWQKCK